MTIQKYKQRGVWLVAIVALMIVSTAAPRSTAFGQSNSLTPLQLKIERQRSRLNSVEQEERRDAVSQLAAMRHPDASRAAISALADLSPSVRATAASAILALPGPESAAILIPLLSDKDEFVRREAAYALGKTRSSNAVVPLVERLRTDKEPGVRGAAAVALGEMSAAAAVPDLIAVISSQTQSAGSKKSKKTKAEQNAFVFRAAARALGQIGDRAALPALLAALANEKNDDDLRRESAAALGLIGDETSLPGLRDALSARDPYLSLAANDAIKMILKSKVRPGM